MYESGRGVPQDFLKAREWYAKAAEQGDQASQFFAGQLYENGAIFGIPTDKHKAVEWYTKAAKQGSVAAQKALKRLQ